MPMETDKANKYQNQNLNRCQVISKLIVVKLCGCLLFLFLAWLLLLGLIVLCCIGVVRVDTLVSDLKGKAFNLSPLNVMLAVGLTYVAILNWGPCVLCISLYYILSPMLFHCNLSPTPNHGFYPVTLIWLGVLWIPCYRFLLRSNIKEHWVSHLVNMLSMLIELNWLNE